MKWFLDGIKKFNGNNNTTYTICWINSQKRENAACKENYNDYW